MNATESFLKARDFLLASRTDYEAATRGFRWPELDRFNWATDWFDVLASGNRRTALRILHAGGRKTEVSFEEMAQRSHRVARYLQGRGVERGDRILVMLPNALPIWDVMLAAMRLGAVVVPATTQLTRREAEDRVSRGEIAHVVAEAAGTDRLDGLAGLRNRLVVGGKIAGWEPYDDALNAPADPPPPHPETHADDPLLLYFTSGTTARPKLVTHTHRSYPVGHLSTMYWIGLREGDVHQTISSPGWAKHAWSGLFAPWNAGATVFVQDGARFNAKEALAVLREHGVATLCAPPTVWRMLILEELGQRPEALRELTSTGEPLNPEVIEHVRRAWGLTIRDGYGQTETTVQIGNTPGQTVRLGSMGRPLPGYQISLLDLDGREAADGEIALRLSPRPAGLMQGYLDDPARTAAAMAGGYYRTGDTARKDEDGYLHYVRRGDDVFKSSDYRISPFELESVLIEHPAVAEVAIVPSPDPVRLCVPKAYVVLRPGFKAGKELAKDILDFTGERLAPYKRIRRIEFGELPKTISGKIRHVQLRKQEDERFTHQQRGPNEFWSEDFDG